MSEKLYQKINESVDSIIDNINNNSNKQKNLNEGTIGSILYFFGLAGLPKHRKFQLYQKHYNTCVSSCEKTYGGERTIYTSKKDAYSQMGDSQEKDLKDTEKMDEQMVKENPEKARCITRCRTSFLKNIINLIKQEGDDKICANNISKSECKKWLEDNLEDLEVELEYLEQAVHKINKIKDNKKLERILSRVVNKYTTK